MAQEGILAAHEFLARALILVAHKSMLVAHLSILRVGQASILVLQASISIPLTKESIRVTRIIKYYAKRNAGIMGLGLTPNPARCTLECTCIWHFPYLRKLIAGLGVKLQVLQLLLTIRFFGDRPDILKNLEKIPVPVFLTSLYSYY